MLADKYPLKISRIIKIVPILFLLLIVTGCSARPADIALSVGPASGSSLNQPASQAAASQTAAVQASALGEPSTPGVACAGAPTVNGGRKLTDCVSETFNVGGIDKTVTVYYTTTVATDPFTDSNGVAHSLQHYINNAAQAQAVAQQGRAAWERYYAIFNHHPFDTGCGNTINVQLEDGIGWAGIAYWASSGSCHIGIDAPMVRGGGDAFVVYHEFQHYLQYSFNSGCYAYIYAHYDSGSAAGVAEFVEGYADAAADGVDAAQDATHYVGINYNPTVSMYDKSYGNLYNKYFIEQLGSLYSTADPWYHMDALRSHYEACDTADTLYVLDTLIPSLRPGETEESFFMDFFAANWAKNWASATTQPELVYWDDDAGAFADIALAHDENISSGSKSWSGETTPDDWAGKYYQVKPQTGCNFVTAKVDGTPGANLGINLMAAKTSAPTSVLRYAWLGENFARTFPGAGAFDRIAASVNAFATLGSYDVSFTCVTPVLDILEPRQTNFALVGDPASPIAFLGRFKLTDGSSPVLGLTEAQITAEAESAAVTIVPGSFQMVGEEYWATMIPPTKPAGTAFVDLKICAYGTVCDTETHALLYVAPGNTDFALVFDASGSMDDVEPGADGTRLENAKKAGTVLADLLRVGDRILITDFSAHDNPPGCGATSHDCELDLGLKMARTDVTDPVSAAIAAAKVAISNITAREWTPIGAALRDAKDRLLAGTTNTNPKHIVLLSDGDENVNPMYAAVQAELIASGVVIDTIRLSNDAPGALLAQIASDTGGSYRYVPTTAGSLARSSAEQLQEQQARAAQLASMGVPDQFIDSLTATVQPGPLGLDDVYDYYETIGQGASRLNHANYPNIADRTPQTMEQYVDPGVNTLRIVVAGKQEDNEGGCSYERYVEVYTPDLVGKDRWIPISPRNSYTPLDWDIRNSLYDDVAIIPSPTPGLWKVRVWYAYCLGATAGTTSEPQAGINSDFMINISAETNISLQGRFLYPIVSGVGNAGDVVPIVATLMGKEGTIPGAWIIGVIEKPGGVVDILWSLYDDGAHSDGAANDGIYGAFYSLTTVGGTYNVRLFALWSDGTGTLTRDWNGAFWIVGPDVNDQDKDGMPDPWEARCKLNTKENDAQGDMDHDGLVNIEEYLHGTIPCDPDTDNGGESDGSEVEGGRDPLFPRDDKVSPLRHFEFRGLNAMIRIDWTQPLTYTNMILYLSTDSTLPGRGRYIGNGGIFTVTQVANDLTYYAWLVPSGDGAVGPLGDPVAVTPKLDPDPPVGAILINNNAPTTRSPNVILNISSTDVPLEGIADSVNAPLSTGGPLALKYNEVSGGVEMRISTDPTFADANWEPLSAEKNWQLPTLMPGVYRVYAQFRDAAGNVSMVVFDEILYDPYMLYLSMLVK